MRTRVFAIKILISDLYSMLTYVLTHRAVFKTFEFRVLTVIDCPKIAGDKGQ